MMLMLDIDVFIYTYIILYNIYLYIDEWILWTCFVMFCDMTGFFWSFSLKLMRNAG